MDPRTRHCSVLGWRSEIDGPLIGWTRKHRECGGRLCRLRPVTQTAGGLTQSCSIDRLEPDTVVEFPH